MSVLKFIPKWRATGTAAVLALLAAGPLLAQQTGTLTGTVISQGNGQPLGDVQIAVQGVGLGQLTNQDGRFLIVNVPVGEHTVTAQLIGYGAESQTVTVTVGEPVILDFTLRVRAVQLEGMVVTGTPIAAERREVGNSIELVTAEQIEAMPVTSVEDILRGRALGVSVAGLPSQPGAGQRVLLRGVNSITGRNEPLVYIDGVRMMSDAWEGSGGSMGGNESATGFAGIDPRDIERIEIIKGAAASTLYGTEAAAGVIQIFTKRGRPGAPRWTANVDQTVTHVGHVGPDDDKTGLHLNDCTFGGLLRPEQTGPDPDCPSSGSWLKTGHGQKYDANVRGGSDEITYFLSTGWNKEVGNMNVKNDGASNFNVRSNFQFNTFEDLSIRFNASYRRQYIDWIPMGSGDESLISNITYLDDGATPDDQDLLTMDKDLEQTIQQMNFSANINWLPRDNFRHRLNIGVDHSNSLYYQSRPYGYFDDPEGTRTRDEEIRRFLTLDYSTSVSSGIPFLNSDFTSVISAGGQYNATEDMGMRVDVNDVVGPGNWETDDYADITNYNEDYSGRHQGGFFLQGQFGWKGRAFLTAGFRADSHSNFGEDLEHDYFFLIYPKVQATYTLSDHTWWPQSWETARIRMAYGESGEPPPPGESLITWRTVQADENVSVYQINNGGNTEIGPEITKEWEVGLDGSFLLGKVNYTATAYQRKTYDGLVYVWPASSEGLEEQYLRNLGNWEAKGIETALDLLVYDGMDMQFSINGRYQWNETKMVKLSNNPLEEFDLRYVEHRYRIGLPMPSFMDQKIQNPNELGVMPVYSDTAEYYGPTNPPHEASAGFTLNMWNRFTLDAFFLGHWGHTITDIQASYMVQSGPGWPTQRCVDIVAAMELYNEGNDAAIAPFRALDIARCYQGYRETWANRADFVRLGTLTTSYRLPEDWLARVPGGFDQATIQFTAMNLWHWTKFPGMHPEALAGSAAYVDRAAGFIIPPPKRFTLNLRLNF
jgi:TonB-dependent SusC/RagA subfamily outer membrane receptor